MSQPNTTRHHADWLSLVEVSGPFVSLPVILRVFPHGLDPREPAQAKALRTAYEEWQDNPSAPGKQHAWVMHVLTTVLGYPQDLITEGQALPAGMESSMPEMGETLRPDLALVGPSGSDTAGQAQLLIASYSDSQLLDKPVVGKFWKATPATRMMELLHGCGVSLGLVTNGEHWMMVYAPRGEITGYASWYSALWMDEPITLRAFHSLLDVRRFFGVSADNTLLALLKESANDQQEVTDQLGYQVREAVKVLVQSFDALDKESGRTLLKGVSPSDQYDASLTVMMRLVFLFSAEERGMLHLGKPLYDDNYAVSTLQEQLQEVADQHGEEVLERRYDAWARLLATFRAIHGGIHHQDLMMQSYGGSLFNPDRYPFLEGRIAGSAWRNTSSQTLEVNNRVVLHLLNSLQRLRTKTGGMAETRRVSFRALGVEQIGHVYEGLLDHTAVLASEPALGIIGTRSKESEILLATLEGLQIQGQDKLFDYLKEETGKSVSALRKAFESGNLLEEHKLLIACEQNEDLLIRVRPFAGLIREDSFDRPLVVMSGSVYVTSGTTRRSTGTHYTPPSLTEPIVQHTLEPLVYEGPAEDWPREKWKLRLPKEILNLRICDMAMGSGAFLVQVCRYLAERLIEAWENEEKKHPGEVLITPDGKFSVGASSERLVPVDENERIAIARRVIANRCLYGVDINPMAVEMAKLSLWLITMDANRPFTFLDHAFKCGDSLLGITSLKQLEYFSLRAGSGKVQGFNVPDLKQHIKEAQEKRGMLEAMASDTPEQIEAKVALYNEAEVAVAKLSAAADVLIAVELKGLKGKTYESERESSSDHMIAYWAKELHEFQGYAQQRLAGRNCFHWVLAFPEIIGHGGFDAFVGNPPFISGKRITTALDTEYRNYLVEHIASGKRGHADICAYFFIRINTLLCRDNGIAGLVATNTISQGDTREVGLDQIITTGTSIIRAIPSTPWPGAAALEVSYVWLRHGLWKGACYIVTTQVASITPFLSAPGSVVGNPVPLKSNLGKSFIGTYVLGMGFVLSQEEAKLIIKRNPRNSLVLFPYLNGEDLNSRFDQSPSRWVINFFDWPLDRSATGQWIGSTAQQQKLWRRDYRVPTDYPDHVASDFPDCLAIVEQLVKPERTRQKDNGDYVLRYPLYERWWIYADKRPALYESISSSSQVLVVCRVTKYLAPAIVDASWIFDIGTAVFNLPTNSGFALLQSTIHEVWAREHCSTLETRLRYSPTDAFDTFAFPLDLNDLESSGKHFATLRTQIMEARMEGLTKIYNRFHDPAEVSSDIAELRQLQIEMDQTVAVAYGWKDLDLGHGFHETKRGIRYTISEVARLEVLDRLLALNHQRHSEEEDERAAQAAAVPAKRSNKKTIDNPTHKLFE